VPVVFMLLRLVTTAQRYTCDGGRFIPMTRRLKRRVPGQPAVDEQGLTGDVARFVGAQECRRGGRLLRTAGSAHRDVGSPVRVEARAQPWGR
jgi:hypothetical protein